MKPAAAFVLALLAGTASAQTAVWRCGNAYADAPCPGGVAVAASDPRTAQDRAAARDLLERDLALADRLRREREALQKEQAVKGSGLFGIKPAAEPPALRPKAEPKSPKKPKAPKRLHRPAAEGTSPSAARGSRSPAG